MIVGAERLLALQRGFVLDSYAKETATAEQHKAAFQKSLGEVGIYLSQLRVLVESERDRQAITSG